MKKRPWITIKAERGRDPYDPFACPVCGLRMVWFERNMAVHKRFHNNILDIEEKYAVCLGASAREKLKIDAPSIVSDPDNIKAKGFAFLLEWYSRFMRSLIAYQDVDKHPSFEDYISMILYQYTYDGQIASCYDPGVLPYLYGIFGTRKGLPGGSYYMDDYRRVYGYPFDMESRGKLYPRNTIPDDYREKAVRDWVINWAYRQGISDLLMWE